MTNAGAITFRSLMTEDLPLMHAWINTPHVAEWWDPMPTLDDVARKYGGRIAGQEPTRSFVIECDERPIGYIQTYRIADYPEYAKQLDVRENAAGVDLFIGDATRVGRGTRTRYRSFCGQSSSLTKLSMNASWDRKKEINARFVATRKSAFAIGKPFRFRASAHLNT